MALLLKNIACLAGISTQNKLLRGTDLSALQTFADAYLLIEGEQIAAYGAMSSMPAQYEGVEKQIDLQGQFVLPAWCDSHTHLVFPRSREDEFVDKLRGLSYAEIAAKGGGILNSARQLNAMSEDALFALAWPRLQEAMQQGTCAIEIKSGYGLTVEGELKMLRVIRKLKQQSGMLIKATFLGAHAFPLNYRDDHDAYIRTIIEEMLPAIAQEKLADYVDVFCETGFFSPDETETICKAAAAYGLLPKLHVNQLNSIGGLQKAVALNAISADHLEIMTDDDIDSLANSSTIGTLLPTAAYFLRLPFPPARKMIDAGAAIALASDFNPGSSPGSNMHAVVSMACIAMRMLPEEAINAATINGAYAMQLENAVGSISIGKLANLIITQPIPSLAYIPYAFSASPVAQVMHRGAFI
ncbi:MAG: imidazolonepropionase [Bacteroidetes bacterium]|nr:imidazolonepropionase [Bacteroidota bacterium]